MALDGYFHERCLMHDVSNSEEWKKIAEQIAKESDSEKLELLLKELCNAFDIERKQTKYGRLE